MKPLFTIHEGEFLVGDHINRKLGKLYDVWVPTKDTGVDLLVTRKSRRGRSVGLQVKFSRSFDIHKDVASQVIATSWFTIDPKKIRDSQADFWVFAILTLRHEEHYVVVPTQELRRRIPRIATNRWPLYLWVYKDKSCYEVRSLKNKGRIDTLLNGVQDSKLDYTEWLNNWGQLETFSEESR